MIFKYLTALFYLSILFKNIFAGSIIVYNDDKETVEFVYVLNTSNNNWTITDNSGYTHLPTGTKINDSLRIQRYGYDTLMLIYKGKNLFVNLSNKPIPLEDIYVSGWNSYEDSGSRILNIEKKVGSKDISHKEYLELLPGIQVKTLGGPGSIVTVSLNGGPTSQTKVTMNGFDLTNMQTGVSDLSQIPTVFINKARVINSGDRLLSSGSQNGVLELNTWKPTNSFSNSFGSFNSYSSNVQLALQSKRFNISFIAGANKSDGDFKVSWRGNSFKRLNNNFDQNYSSFQFIGRLTPSLFLKGFTLISSQKRGVPGLVWSPLNATHNDEINIIASSLNWFSKLGKGSVEYIYKISDDKYVNPTYNNKNRNQLASSSLSILNPIFKKENLFSYFKVNFQNQKLNSDGRNYEKNIFIVSSSSIYNVSSRTKFSVTYQKNYSKNFFDKTTTSTKLDYKLKEYLFIDKISISSSSHFRHPTFNDLYWKPGGNSNLKSETGMNKSINFWLKPVNKNIVDLNLFYSNTKNLIQWLPLQSFWQARNLNDVKRYGLTANWAYNLKLFNGRISYSIIESHYGIDKKPLRYSPKNIGTILLEKKLGKFSISCSTHFTGEMISAYSYPKNNIVQKNSTTSININKKTQLQRMELVTSFSALNVFDTEYESSVGYPEPGRNFKISITLNQKRKH